MIGLLNVNKPADMTSRDVVNCVQRLVRPHKVGHAGTLDPLATGVLVLCVGAATRLIEYVQQQPKRYVATFRLGFESASDDIEEETFAVENAPMPTAAEIAAALPAFVGEIEQVPPAFSAVHVGGKRAYKLARQGKAVELAPRPVTVYSIDVVAYDYPDLTLNIRCGGGTYVRAIGRDLAVALGTRAVMSQLVREAVGEFELQNAARLESITKESIPALLLPARLAVSGLTSITLDATAIADLAAGRWIPLPPEIEPASREEYAVLNGAGELTAIAIVQQNRLLRPMKVLQKT